MELTAIDTVPAYSLEVGDIIRFIDEDGENLGLQTIKHIDDYGIDAWIIVSEQDDEMYADYDTPFYIYAYTD